MSNVVGDLGTAGNILSLVGCAIIIGSYVISRRRSHASGTPSAGSGHAAVHQDSLLLMAITNVLLNLGGLIYSALDWQGNRGICVVQGLHITYFNVSNWFWTLCISLNILLIIRRKTFYPNKLVYIFAFVCWAVPAVLVMPMLVTRDQSIVNVGPWCWIPASNLALRYGVFYGWLIATYIVNVIILGFILQFVYQKETETESFEKSPQYVGRRESVRTPGQIESSKNIQPLKTKQEQYRNLVRRYISYIFVILLTWIFGIILRFAQVSNPAFNSPILTALHTFFSISQMLWLSIVLVLSSHISRISNNIRRGSSSTVAESRRPSIVPLNDGRRESIAQGRRESILPSKDVLNSADTLKSGSDKRAEVVSASSL